VDRTAALDELPESYAVALRLRDAGHDDTAIALGIELESGQERYALPADGSRRQ
jgi:hypothetical protein